MITFFSNFINEHQIPFCNAMYEKTNGQFRFVATEPISEERLSMGFVDQSDKFPYVVKSYEDFEEALRLGKESDVVIIGSAPDGFIVDRLKENKLTFRYCERYFKEGRWRIFDPRVFCWRYKNDFRYRNKNIYMLCASAYTAPDCRFILSYPDKCYKWGYFPPIEKYEDVDELIRLKHPASILWVGRLMGWKHPEAAIETAKKLKQAGYVFHLTMIGEGEEKESCKRLIEKYQLMDKVDMLGFISPKKVREYMKKADIYLFTSDQNEGWGAVLNESMNSASAVVACREIGSVPYVVKHGENGLIYDRQSKNSLYINVKRLLDDEELKHKLQRNAYATMISTWNADTASERLLDLINCIQKGKEIPYQEGPCSKD